MGYLEFSILFLGKHRSLDAEMLLKSSVVKLGRRCKKLNLFFSSIGKRSSLYSVNRALMDSLGPSRS